MTNGCPAVEGDPAEAILVVFADVADHGQARVFDGEAPRSRLACRVRPPVLDSATVISSCGDGLRPRRRGPRATDAVSDRLGSGAIQAS